MDGGSLEEAEAGVRKSVMRPGKEEEEEERAGKAKEGLGEV